MAEFSRGQAPLSCRAVGMSMLFDRLVHAVILESELNSPCDVVGILLVHSERSQPLTDVRIPYQTAGDLTLKCAQQSTLLLSPDSYSRLTNMIVNFSAGNQLFFTCAPTLS